MIKTDTGRIGYLSRDPLVVSFYTEKTPYQLEVLQLVESCQALEIEHSISAVPCRGSWELNCTYKPFFIREQLQKHKRALFWVDADAVFLQKPHFPRFSACDVSVRFMQRFSQDSRFFLNAATLFINDSKEAFSLVDRWCAVCQKELAEGGNPEFLDQRTLLHVLKTSPGLKILPMPVEYCAVLDLDAADVKPQGVIIEQRQASRRFRGFFENYNHH